MAITNFDTVVAGLGGSRRLSQNRRYTFEDFSARPTFRDQDGSGEPTGATGDENIMDFPGTGFEYHILGAGQTILFPSWGVNGLDVGSFDATDDEGAEYTQGILSNSKAAMVIGTDAFFARATISIADVSGTDDCAFGFRLAEAYQANIDDYNDMAALNVISGNVNIETILNGGSTTTTDTTANVADTGSITMEVRVTAGGVVSYLIDGAVPATVAAFTFDNADVVVPFLYLLNASDLHGAVQLSVWEVGLLSSRGLDGVGDLNN